MGVREAVRERKVHLGGSGLFLDTRCIYAIVAFLSESYCPTITHLHPGIVALGLSEFGRQILVFCSSNR
jgi:hypothetical protein